MTIETSPAVAAGWYPDPAGTPQVRWWSGAGWTEHFAPQVEVVAEPQVASPAQVAPTPVAPAPVATPVAETPAVPAAPPYRFDASPSAPLRYDPSLAKPARGAVSNRSAWLSLGLGALAVILVVGHLAANQGGYLVTLSAVTSIIWGIVALVRRSKGRSTVAWAPVVGILLGLTASVITVLSLIGVFATAAPAAASGSSNSSSTSTGPHVYPANPALSTVQAQEASLVGALEDSNGGGTTLAAGDTWPASLVVTSANKIMTPDGTYLGMLPSGVTLVYNATAGGNFQMQMHGADASEVSIYNSSTNTYTVSCSAGDKTCTPA
jgi:hypothetical protein